jgi:hypothetical protein
MTRLLEIDPPNTPVPPPTVPSDDLRNVFPFSPGEKDDFSPDCAVIPTLGSFKTVPDPFDPELVKVSVPVNSAVGCKPGDYGYVLLVADAQDNYVAYPVTFHKPTETRPFGLLSATFIKPRPDIKIKVTILTKKSVPIQLA